jgi:hypothetical protein
MKFAVVEQNGLSGKGNLLRARLVRKIADHIEGDHPPDGNVFSLSGSGMNGAPHLGSAEIRGLLVRVGDELDPILELG